MLDLKNQPLIIFSIDFKTKIQDLFKFISEFKNIATSFDFKYAFQIPFLTSETIHQDLLKSDKTKLANNFINNFSKDDLKQFQKICKEANFFVIGAPFDESSITLFETLKFDALHISNHLATDWPLLEYVGAKNFPVILSTGGVVWENLDQIVAFFMHRNKHLCLMHNVLPIASSHNKLQLNQIDLFRQRYENLLLGYALTSGIQEEASTRIAISKGVQVIEKQLTLVNDFSVELKGIHNWLEIIQGTFEMCRFENQQNEVFEKDRIFLHTLSRGVVSIKEIKKGETLNLENISFMLPNISGQLLTEDISKYREITALEDIPPNQPVMHEKVKSRYLREKVLSIVKATKKMLDDCKIYLPNYVEIEISHHYGLDRFEEWGGILLKVVNREYCKMLLILFPGQNYPNHLHKQKEESLHILHGDLNINIEGEDKELVAGDIVTIERGVMHSFKTKTGVIIEEISTTYYNGDSYYEDESIYHNPNRKIKLSYWLKDKY